MRYVCVLLLLTLVACSGNSSSVELRSLERPEDIAFTCFGDLRVDGTVSRQPQPVASCQSWVDGVEPIGQEDVVRPNLFGFVLQPEAGTVAVMNYPTIDVTAPLAFIDDADRLTPGKNAIPVGSRPAAITTDETGCFASVISRGTCDLAHIDVNTAVDANVPTTVERVAFTNAVGDPFVGVPLDMVVRPSSDSEIGVACPDDPVSPLYVAFPECGVVAQVVPGTGEIVAAIQFDAVGNASITDGNVSCAASCGGVVPDGQYSADSLAISDDGSRLVIGGFNGAHLTVVDLDVDGTPTQVLQVPLEGEVGVTELAITEVIAMGGEIGDESGTAGDFQFVYAVATDGTVRVADILNLQSECDTQVDPRFLLDDTNVVSRSCFPVGDIMTPPRRAGAKSPGIQLFRGVLALDVAVTKIYPELAPERNHQNLVGHFAFVTGSDGSAYTINIDDDNYPDFERPAELSVATTSFTMAHQLRDGGLERDYRAVKDDGTPFCSFPNGTIGQYAPRVSGPTVVDLAGFGSVTKGHLLPTALHQVCEEVNDDGNTQALVPELSVMADEEARERAFPDWNEVPIVEDWTWEWEGPFTSFATQELDGPLIRFGFFDGAGTLVDETAPFCRMGIEPFDIVQLVGCDPSQGDGGCGVGQECYLPPDTATAFGVCLPEEEVDSIAARCGEVFSSFREYSVIETRDRELVLGERARVLGTTPIDGCDSDNQCNSLWTLEQQVESSEHPKDFVPSDDEFSWSCQADPTRSSGIDRCVMTCETRDDCETGYTCSESGVCVSGTVPTAECFPTLQTYTALVGEAFSVIGSGHGFLHNRVADTDGTCIDDPNGNPLNVSRVPLRVPDCGAIDDYSVNPCLATMERAYYQAQYEDAATCQVSANPDDRFELVTQEEPALRLHNPVFTAHLATPFSTGDAQCNGDNAGDAPEYSPVFRGYSVSWEIVGGFVPQLPAAEARYPKHIVKGPTGQMWVMDQGDFVSNTVVANGQLVRFNPENLVQQLLIVR